MTTGRTYPPPAKAPAGEPLRDAPVSITIKGMLRGRDTMVTLRGRELLTVLDTCEAALLWFAQTETGTEAEPSHGAQRYEAPSNGHGTYAPGAGETPYCVRHGVPLRRHSKGGQVWYSHQLGNGLWCRGAEG